MIFIKNKPAQFVLDVVNSLDSEPEKWTPIYEGFGHGLKSGELKGISKGATSVVNLGNGINTSVSKICIDGNFIGLHSGRGSYGRGGQAELEKAAIRWFKSATIEMLQPKQVELSK